MDAVAIAGVSLLFSLVALCAAIYVTLRRGTDADFDELASHVARLNKRARADTMRRVRQEARDPQANGEAVVDPPPQLRAPLTGLSAPQNRQELKAQLRKKAYGTGVH